MDMTRVDNLRVVSPPPIPAVTDGGSVALADDAAATATAAAAAAPQTAESSAPAPLAWFDRNGDGVIDNVSVMYGGDAYFGAAATPSSPTRMSVHAPQRQAHAAPHAAAAANATASPPVRGAHPATPQLLARAQATYAAHAAPRPVETRAAASAATATTVAPMSDAGYGWKNVGLVAPLGTPS